MEYLGSKLFSFYHHNLIKNPFNNNNMPVVNNNSSLFFITLAFTRIFKISLLLTIHTFFFLIKLHPSENNAIMLANHLIVDMYHLMLRER